MEWANPPTFPALTLPEAPGLPGPILEVPQAELPSYKPIVVPPSVNMQPPGVKGINKSDEPPDKEGNDSPSTNKTKLPPNIPPEAQIVDVPFIDMELPMPSTIVMTTAVTTAFISVAATLTATSLFKYIVMIMKPVFKQIWSKITKKKDQETEAETS